MTIVPGTYFIQEQLEEDLKVDNISDGDHTGGNRMNHIGFEYETKNKQYDKALAWYILAAMENHPTAQNNIGCYYYHGRAVPKNYLCSLKWCLKSAERNECGETPKNIGDLFEHGYGVPVDKYKALEWYCYHKDKTHRERLKSQGYHRSPTEKKKTLEQLIKESKAILEAEKEKLERIRYRTPRETETLEQLNITYKLVDGGEDAWDDIPILLASGKQRNISRANSSAATSENEIPELKTQMQLLMQEKNTFESQSKQLQALKQENATLELRIKEKDKEIKSLGNDKQSLQQGYTAVQLQIKAYDNTISSLRSENQELKLKINNLEYQLREKDININSLENENRIYHRSSLTQTQKLEMLNHEKATLEQTKMYASLEMERLKASNIALAQSKQENCSEIERLKASNANLEKLLKSKEDATVSLNEDYKNLTATNQLITDMVETQKSLLLAKTNEMELLRQNMEYLLANERQRNDALGKENRLLKKQRSREQRSRLNIYPTHVVSGHDDGNPHNDISYDTEDGNTEGSDGDDINYDTPSEDERK